VAVNDCIHHYAPRVAVLVQPKFRLVAVSRSRVRHHVCNWARLVLAVAAPLVLVAAGCSSGPPNAAAEVAARNFVNAVRNGDGSTACGLLTDQARSSIGGALDVSCPRAVTHVAERSGSVRGAQVWGDAAQVRIGSDVVFLRLVSGQWLVSAAGCTRQLKGPYDCKVGG
jgi:hypothetical protein